MTNFKTSIFIATDKHTDLQSFIASHCHLNYRTFILSKMICSWEFDGIDFLTEFQHNGSVTLFLPNKKLTPEFGRQLTTIAAEISKSNQKSSS